MKITKSKLKQIIKEELKTLVIEGAIADPQLNELFGFGKSKQTAAGAISKKNEELKDHGWTWKEAQAFVERVYSKDVIRKLEANGRTEAAKQALAIKNAVKSGQWEIGGALGKACINVLDQSIVHGGLGRCIDVSEAKLQKYWQAYLSKGKV